MDEAATKASQCSIDMKKAPFDVAFHRGSHAQTEPSIGLVSSGSGRR
jgi:hypothetical protein